MRSYILCSLLFVVAGCRLGARYQNGNADLSTTLGDEVDMSPSYNGDLSGSCSESDNRCSDDGNKLISCHSSGVGFDEISCSGGCAATPSPHCRLIFPAAPITSGDESTPGTTDLSLPLDPNNATNPIEWRFNTETGEIKNDTTTLRPMNTVLSNVEVHSGIAFHAVDGVGIFAFSSLTVPAPVTVKLLGANGAALVVASDISIQGVIDARPMDGNGILCVKSTGGPGGGKGGTPAVSAGSGMVTPSTPGGGPGGGTGGGTTAGAAGGGGGGHAAIGGNATSGIPATPGVGGATYDDLTKGGSGGGGSGEKGASSGYGGGGGGLVRLVAPRAITIGGATKAGINAGGCGGFGQSGAGGGGSGGTIVVESNRLQLITNGVLAANGGGGGFGQGSTDSPANGANASLDDQVAYGGGAGSPTIRPGGNGGAGASLPGTDARGPDSSIPYGNGGGGAAGRIYLVTFVAPALGSAAIVSPTVASGGASVTTADLH